MKRIGGEPEVSRGRIDGETTANMVKIKSKALLIHPNNKDIIKRKAMSQIIKYFIPPPFLIAHLWYSKVPKTNIKKATAAHSPIINSYYCKS